MDNQFASVGSYHSIECTRYRHSGNDRPCICDVESARFPKVGEVWVSGCTGNYWRIDSIQNSIATVTRVGYVSDGKYTERYPEQETPYYWHLTAFSPNMHRLEVPK